MKTNPLVIIYADGVAHCSVCAEKNLSRQQIEAEVNALSPTGLSGGWKIDEARFAGGEANPHPCEDAPDERLHYLMVC